MKYNPDACKADDEMSVFWTVKKKDNDAIQKGEWKISRIEVFED